MLPDFVDYLCRSPDMQEGSSSQWASNPCILHPRVWVVVDVSLLAEGDLDWRACARLDPWISIISDVSRVKQGCRWR